MPGRQSNFRDVPGAAPFFLQSATDLTYTDADGRQFVDFTISMGAAIWGYGDEEYKDAVRDQLDTLLAMSSGAAQSALEVELAEAIVDHDMRNNRLCKTFSINAPVTQYGRR